MPPAGSPLLLDAQEIRLPDARLDQRYQRTLNVRGGRPPYQFKLIPGEELPPGLGLEAPGQISGLAAEVGHYRFALRVQDGSGQQAQQSYTLQVLPALKSRSAGASAATAAAAPTSTASAPPLELVTPASTPRPPPVLMYSYQLDASALDAFVAPPATGDQAPPPEPGPAGDSTDSAAAADKGAGRSPPTTTGAAGASAASAAASAPRPPTLSDEALAELSKIVTPLLGIEHPSRAMFEAALDLRLCQHVRAVVLENAEQAKRPAPSDKALAAHCPPAWPAWPPPGAASRAGAAAAPASAPASAVPVSWKTLPQTLLTSEVRAWLIDLARKPHAIQALPAIAWQGGGCGCLRSDLDGKQVFGLYPFWWNQQQLQPRSGPALSPPLPKSEDKAQLLDFSMISRISLLALPLDAEQIRGALGPLDSDNTAFIREARRHRSRIDLTLSAPDWQLLAPLPQGDAEAARQRKLLALSTELPRAVQELIDTPLPGLLARAASWLPGFAEPQYLADGVTLMLLAPPPAPPGQPDLRPAFKAFYPKLVRALVDQLRRGSRDYALNLVMDSGEIGAAPALFEPGELFELIKHTELPALELPYYANGRIVETTGNYRSATNVTLNLLVLMAEPTSASKRLLQSRVQNDEALHGINRRVFLRKLVPVLMAGPKPGIQYADDLAFFEDNFGGVGYWPLLLQPEHAEMNKVLTRALSTEADDSILHPLCNFQCEHRWWFRGLFFLALLTGAATLPLVNWRCELRRRWDLGLKTGSATIGLLFLSLLGCDPALASWREHGALVMLLMVALLLSALWNWVKPREDKP